jgi:hypothetical protein
VLLDNFRIDGKEKIARLSRSIGYTHPINSCTRSKALQAKGFRQKTPLVIIKKVIFWKLRTI